MDGKFNEHALMLRTQEQCTLLKKAKPPTYRVTARHLNCCLLKDKTVTDNCKRHNAGWKNLPFESAMLV